MLSSVHCGGPLDDLVTNTKGKGATHLLGSALSFQILSQCTSDCAAQIWGRIVSNQAKGAKGGGAGVFLK